MNQTHSLISVRRLVLLAMMPMLVGAPGCTSATLDTTQAFEALGGIHARLVEAAEQQAALSDTFATALSDIAAERLRLTLLLDLDELLAPDGRPDADAIPRLLRDGSENAVVREVRVGRLTLDQANQLVSDAAQARGLSPDLRAATEEQLIARFADWQRLAATRGALITELDGQAQATARLLAEAGELTGTIRDATAGKLHRSIRIATTAQTAVGLIHDPDLRESVRALIDVLLASSDTITSRSQDQ